MEDRAKSASKVKETVAREWEEATRRKERAAELRSGLAASTKGEERESRVKTTKEQRRERWARATSVQDNTRKRRKSSPRNRRTSGK